MLDIFFTLQGYFLQFFVIPMLICVGFWVSCKMGWLHILKIPIALKCLFAPAEGCRKNISSFSAFSAILGGNLGVGNLSGTAIALATGGPGSIIWMIIIILFTASIKYVTCYLSLVYRTKVGTRFIGGPMYFLRDGLKSKVLSLFFCIGLVCTATIGGGLVQVNSLALPMDYLHIPRIYGGLIFTVLVALVTFGRLRFFTQVVSFVVPFMAIGYLGVSLYILVLHADKIPNALLLMLTSIWSRTDIQGGVVGFAWMQFLTTMQMGISRGIFASDIGFGLEGILHANVKQEEGHKLPLEIEQGLIGVISPFIVLLVCFVTALVLMVTGVAWGPFESTNMCFEAFRVGAESDVAGYLLIVVLFCFAFTTVLTWSFCAQCAFEYLTNYNPKVLKLWKVFFVLVLPFGALSEVYFLWRIVDLTSAIMLVTNLIGIVFLAGGVTHESNNNV
ncbi:sodium:alanine symporter family protein [Neorickettsia sennetsu str. Miyayama]|uniref:Sodium:alanine symporter family protein n=2 Tax=Ehrlichia sennetsu TaxID=951 RepID=Q2GEP5_EHRS3|nr:sodium:alanine symporter family protein [Neorickettsia sennetsu str. Miyayama]